MLDRVLSARIREYAPANPVEQENVLQELIRNQVTQKQLAEKRTRQIKKSGQDIEISPAFLNLVPKRGLEPLQAYTY